MICLSVLIIWMRIDIIWTSIDILKYMEMATLNINEKCFFKFKICVYFIFCICQKEILIHFKTYSFSPLIIADFDFGNIDIGNDFDYL